MGVTTFSTRLQKYDLVGSVDQTGDTQDYYTDVTVNYQLTRQDVSRVFTALGPDYTDVKIGPAVVGVLHTTIAKYQSKDVTPQLTQLIAQYQGDLTARLEPSYIHVVSVYFVNNHFAPKYMEANLAVQVAQKSLTRVGYEQQQKVIVARTDANIEVIKAQGLANARIAQASGYATARIKESLADATAQRAQSTALTPLYVQHEIAQRWNGQLPQYSLGTSSGTFLTLPGAKASGK